MSIDNEILRLRTAKADIKTAIENKGVTVGDGTIDTYAEKINEISGGDGGSENPFYYATTMSNIFNAATFPENHNVIIKLSKQIPMAQTFYSSSNVKSITIIADNTESKPVSYAGFTWFCHDVEKIDFSNYGILKPTTVSRLCYQNYALKSIIGKIDLSENTDTFQWLNSCYKLEDIEFVPNTIKISTPFSWCSLLSNKSIQSIFDGLATVETAQTLTLHANLKILQSQVDSANAKGWTVAGGTVVSEEEYYG